MTLREINRQYGHWARFPPPAIALARIGWRLGIEPPPLPSSAADDRPTSHEELKAFAASMGVTSVG